LPHTNELTDTAVRVSYSGLARWVVLLREVLVPYGEIESVEAGLPELPRPRVRIGQYHRRWTLARGRFRLRGGDWIFLDVRHLVRTVVLHLLSGTRFSLVAVEPEPPQDPADVAREIRLRL
jgi:hypothetical protein